MKCGVILTALISLLCSGALYSGQWPDVLVLHSYHPGFTWTGLVMDGINRGFRERGVSPELHIEYMDVKRHTDNDVRKAFLAYLKSKTLKHKFSVIITSDNAALSFALDYREWLFPGVPVVFCGINGPPSGIVRGRKNVTGITEKWDPSGTLDLIGILQPEVREIVVVHDYTESGIGTKKNLVDVMPFYKQFRFRFLPEESSKKTLSRISSLPRDTAVLLLGYNTDSEGRVFDSGRTGPYFASGANVPVYTIDETRFSGGVAGGSLLSGTVQGIKAAEMTSQILTGVAADSIPVIDNPVRHLMVDYEALKKFKIPVSRIPSDAHVVNMPASFYHRYFYQIWTIVFLFPVLVALTLFLIVSRVLKANAESKLKRLADILEATNHIVCTIGMDLMPVYINRAGRAAFSLGEDAVPGFDIYRLFPADERSAVERILEYVRLDGIWSGELRIKTSSGNEIPVSVTAMIHSETRMKSGFVSLIMRDIVEQKKIQEIVAQSEENLRITLESIGEGVISTDASGITTRVNQRALDITGWDHDDIHGKMFREFVRICGNPSCDDILDPVTEVIETGRPAAFAGRDYYLVCRDGSLTNIAGSAAPIRNTDGMLVGVVLVLRDMSEEIRLQEQLHQSQRMETIGQLAGGVAHDFNNILTVILGSAQILENMLSDDEEKRGLVRDIVFSSTQAAELTARLLSFSRKGRLLSVPVDIHNIIDEAVRFLSRSIDRQIAVKKSLHAAQSRVMGDPVSLQSALLNLGINARDAIEGSGEITYSTENITVIGGETAGLELQPGEYILVTVEDNGKGMGPDTLSRIFEPYFTTKPSGKGTGLGLAAVYGCIESHNGSIDVKSEPGKGSVFRIMLPIAESGGAEAVTVSAVPPIHKGEGLIMVVDDEDILRNTAAKILKSLGYSVEAFSSGYDAADFYRENSAAVKLVVLDLIMPEISGVDTFHLLKEINSDVKVLLSSGFTRHENIASIMQKGAAGFINKPYSIEELSKKVWECING